VNRPGHEMSQLGNDSEIKHQNTQNAPFHDGPLLYWNVTQTLCYYETFHICKVIAQLTYIIRRK
jgi:hypothetical protein